MVILRYSACSEVFGPNKIACIYKWNRGKIRQDMKVVLLKENYGKKPIKM